MTCRLFFAVVDFAVQRVLLGEAVAQGGVAPDDGVGHVLQGLGQFADLRRHLLGLDRAHRQAAARIERGDPLQIGDPAHPPPRSVTSSTVISASAKVSSGKRMPESGFSQAQERIPGDWAESTTNTSSPATGAAA